MRGLRNRSRNIHIVIAAVVVALSPAAIFGFPNALPLIAGMSVAGISWLVLTRLRSSGIADSLASVVGAAGAGLWVWDPITGNTTCPSEQFGFDGGSQMLNLDRDRLRQILHPGDHDRVLAEFADAVFRASIFETEFRAVWPDRSVHWFLAKGRTITDSKTGSRQLRGIVLDITASKKPEETLRESEQRFRNAFEEAAVGMVILDVGGCIQSVNKGFTDTTKYSADELIGRPLLGLIGKEHHAQIAIDRMHVIDGKVRNYRAERRFIRKDGESVWIRSSVSLLRYNGDRHTIALCEDITEQRQARENLSRQALHDPLTGLPNRWNFERALKNAINRAKGTGDDVALLYLDLDGFKLVNDTLGHGAGDLLLRQVADRLGDRVSDFDVLARVGGDEFTIVLTRQQGGRTPALLAERLLQGFNTPFQIQGRQINIGASIGISRYPLDGVDASALLRSADTAMYSAKRSGNNRYQFFTAQMAQAADERLTIESCLRRAIENRELSVQYQPQYDLDSDRLVGFEALCRWCSGEIGHVSPNRFIPVAEETGLIVQIGDYVLREACMQALQWQMAASPVQIAVNVSAVQFARAEFVNSVTRILSETGLNPQLLELELTESIFLHDRDDCVRKMALLKDLGIRISIDDFGTGYSSLSYLLNMPVDSLKVDRSFTAKLESSPTAVLMVRAAVAMARAMGLRVVVEGVEQPGQVEILRRLRCDEVQGYLYGRPEDANAARDRVLRELSGGLLPAITGLTNVDIPGLASVS